MFVPVVGYEELLVDENGVVLDRQTNKVMKPIVRAGFFSIHFRRANEWKYVGVHRLVAKAFIPNPYNLPVVHHIDGNSFNNHVDNLKWCMRKSITIVQRKEVE